MKTVTMADIDGLVAEAKQGVMVSCVPVSQSVLDALQALATAPVVSDHLVDDVYTAFRSGIATDTNGVVFKKQPKP